MSIQLLVADRQEIIRKGLVKFFEGTEIEVVAEATNTNETVSLTQEHRPDVVVADLAVIDQKETKARQIFERPVLILSNDACPACVAQARAQGAIGLLSKHCERHELITAVRGAASGNGTWPEKQVRRFDSPATSLSGMEMPLTSRQVEVLRYIASGLTTKEIATALDIRYDTAKEHVQNTIRKIGARSRTHAAVWAVRQGIV